MQPLRREWEIVQAQCEKLWPKIQATGRDVHRKATARASPARKKFDKLLGDFSARLRAVTVLDPACGSGNFHYVALHLLLNLDKEVISYGAKHGATLFPSVKPTQLLGIEINEYAQELASVVIWIGYLQWMHDNGFTPHLDPVLEPFESIRRMDAILDLSDPDNPREPEWPAAEFIVGNPPFLGGNRIRSELGDSYVDPLFETYEGRVPAFADLCCYWFEKARQKLASKEAVRIGLLATQGIRGGANRRVLERIKETGDIFFAESDRNWILDGATVHVSMSGFDSGSEPNKILNGNYVVSIAANLTTGADITMAKRLEPAAALYHEGTKKGAQFELSEASALEMLRAANPHSLPNSDVLRPYINGTDLYGGEHPSWIVYFPPSTDVDEAAKYESPFEYIKENVFPRYGTKRRQWWLHERPRPVLHDALRILSRYLATVRHSKHRIFHWMDSIILPDSALGAIVDPTDFVFGVLQSRPHEAWSLAQGTQVRDRESGFRYTPTSCLDTFVFPESTDSQRKSIAATAKALDTLRNNWLNPPEWTRIEVLDFPGSKDGPWRRYIDAASVDKRGIGIVRYPRIVPKDEECARELKKRTLTNLYNERPTWLDLAHKKLDAAVFAAYGWDSTMTDDELLAALLALNLQRATS
ncbi:MAG: DNA methyltransferase [Planctomycetaceae bacterium]